MEATNAFVALGGHVRTPAEPQRTGLPLAAPAAKGAPAGARYHAPSCSALTTGLMREAARLSLSPRHCLHPSPQLSPGALGGRRISAAQKEYLQQTRQLFDQLTPQQQQMQMQQMQMPQMQQRQQQQQQQMPPPHLPLTFTPERQQQGQQQVPPPRLPTTCTQETVLKLGQKEANAVAKYFREVLKIDVASTYSASAYVNRPTRTLTMLRVDLASKWPEGRASVEVQVR